ncbi:TetR/AcrR family transcriptional regulator [Paenibacillus sp. PAMC21692]|uniref:TetR/AcrR family transcriptional regulator n=1 Tax=Paenibacillus sp. PAMC21692 TaxID=2762320 RepID=UPI00164E7C5D|nr:TetR/AcrR family transcriptional regulator [Paenibacillus sp. PAMC21692]QNK60350.1 TetR/AcrR family transcriptional regulator [Paenibacillus sp. PAMC21692]
MSDTIDKRIVRSKEALKETFLQLLRQKPFHQIAVTELVREARYNRGTFYANFETKENLLNEMLRETLDEMISQIRHPYKSSEKVNMKLLPTGDITLFNYLKDNADLYKLLLSDHIQVDFRYRMAQAIERLFIEEYEYELDEDTRVDIKWLYVYRAHGIAGLIIRWIEDDFPSSPVYMAEQIVELMTMSTEVFHVKTNSQGGR